MTKILWGGPVNKIGSVKTIIVREGEKTTSSVFFLKEKPKQK
jgi:hypothetical protein